MRAIEKRAEVSACLARWRERFELGAIPIGRMGGPVWWQEDLQIWARFGRTERADGSMRPWNAFGQIPKAFRDNMVVEINFPDRGKNLNLQAAFAVDGSGMRWVLHQGRMTIRGKRITEQDFLTASGRQPVLVTFADGTSAPFHPVAPIDARPEIVQRHVAEFVATCALVREVCSGLPSRLADTLRQVQNFERGLNPERTGIVEMPGRDPVVVRRRHADVWSVLAAELDARRIPHSNDRVLGLGPDMFTYDGVQILFEIKTSAAPGAVYQAVGQLAIYERLLDMTFRKVLVLPKGLGTVMADLLGQLRLDLLEYNLEGSKVVFDRRAIDRLVKTSR